MATRALRLLALGSSIAGLMLGGCTVDPYCIVCPGDDLDAGPADSGTDGGMAVDAPRPDAPMDDAPNPDDACPTVELCNDADDDCDGNVDEGIDLTTSVEHCGECNTPCAPIHAFGRCEDSMCAISACDVGFLDLDGDPETGCEYRCIPSAEDDVVCDFRDDDCDGEVDEDVLFETDATNCGRCGRFCRQPHAAAACVAGECALGACETGFYDLDGETSNGCEYTCTPADPPVEVCNSRDDDCNGAVDEGSPGAGVACGIEAGACELGTTACVAGAVVCQDDVEPTSEVCNGADEDCDGMVDEMNPGGGRVCGTSVGVCEVGAQTCTDGALVCVGATEPGVETCNNLDDDCDGTIDQGNPGGGGACGSTTGSCTAGALVCTRGALVCTGGIGPSPELCNGEDDDCDGTTDEGNPEGGSLCGTDVGRCAPGTQQCRSGALVCEGAVGAIAETCDGTDQDCDGVIDNGNPGGGAACGVATGECSTGAVVCRVGTLVCEGAVGARVESCNMLDDDCDARTDETYALTTDINNCGMCGRVCNLANATQRCTAGACVVGACRSGFVNLDGVATNGCEYACSFRGAESCNGTDDDCDGRTDEGLTAPTAFCNPNGVCAGTSATCGGAAGWVCSYPAATFQAAEARCDGLDNDCDGAIDEPFPLRGTACSNGQGTCRRTGTYVCNAAGTAVSCNAPVAGTPADESCNGLDDDCDGLVDEPGVNDPLTAWRDAIDASAIPNVSFTSGGRTVRMMQYEASRPDATASSPGSLAGIACSRPNVMPWTSVTQAQAQAACCALNAGGTCTGSTGWRLCAAADWEVGCEGPAGTCDHSYATSCGTSQPLVCNGMEYDSSTTLAGDQDAIASTGSATFAACYTDWASAGRIYDLSGNVKEWTSTAVGTGIYEVRGGSFQSIEAGRACDFDFTVAEQTFSAETTGFRCCMY
jgi:Notch-like protein